MDNLAAANFEHTTVEVGRDGRLEPWGDLHLWAWWLGTEL